MVTQLVLATADGLLRCQRQAEHWRVVGHWLAGQPATAVVVQPGVILAGTHDGLLRSDDGGTTWRDTAGGLPSRHVRHLACHPTVGGLVYAGLEPAGILLSRDGAATWRDCSDVAHLREERGWFLPYSPGAGCVRGFAFQGWRAYAAVEIGGVLCSDDWGATWRLVEGSSGDPDYTAPVPRRRLHPDVHDIAVPAGVVDVVFAPTMRGLYRSVDGGTSWVHVYADCYTRALWIDPADAGHLILGPAEDVEINGDVEESQDGGGVGSGRRRGCRCRGARRSSSGWC